MNAKASTLSTPDDWPQLPWKEWRETCRTLHLWTQIVGKIRMEQSPWVNHSWSVALYVTASGLSTSAIPCRRGSFQIDFDLQSHQLFITTSQYLTASLPLRPQSVASFYESVMEELSKLGIDVNISAVPNEIPDPIPFAEDTVHTSYDAEYANRFWRVLVQTQRVFLLFRSQFLGKVSPVHLFWGALDLACTRFSGRAAPEHPGGIPNLPDPVTREAYSAEVSSCGFWPGSDEAPDPIFYAYAYPTPEGFSEAAVAPSEAFWLEEMGEFALPYEAVRSSASPDETLLEFLNSTYSAAADLAGWDRERLECPPDNHPLR